MKLKRLLDIVVSLSAIVALAPMFAIVSAILMISQGRPIFIGHERRGHHGKPFKCLKFRTMVINGNDVLRDYFKANPRAHAEWHATRKLRHDPRVTPFGGVLRRSSVDELPQFFNVLLGEMSLVGPRPIVQDEVSYYGSEIDRYEQVRPGLTGLWQISGRNDLSYETRVKLDCEYIREWSLCRDILILCRTIPAVLHSKGCY